MKEESLKRLKKISKYCLISAVFFTFMGLVVVGFVLKEYSGPAWIALVMAGGVFMAVYNDICSVIEEESDQ